MSRHHLGQATALRAARAHWAGLLPVACPRCGRPIIPETPWDVGHIIPAEAGGTTALENTRPEHRHCNRAAGGRRGAAITNHRRALEHLEPARPPRAAPIESEGLLAW